jgi:hypothetical protein
MQAVVSQGKAEEPGADEPTSAQGASAQSVPANGDTDPADEAAGSAPVPLLTWGGDADRLPSSSSTSSAATAGGLDAATLEKSRHRKQCSLSEVRRRLAPRAPATHGLSASGLP